MTAHGLVDGNRGAIACATDVAIQPLKLNMRYTIAAVLIQAGIPQYIP